MTVEYAGWVDPASLGRYDEGPWCRTCGFRADRSPAAGGCGCPRPCALDDPFAAHPGPVVAEWPSEIEMVNGPNIIVPDRAQYDAIRAAMAQNARLAARNEP